MKTENLKCIYRNNISKMWAWEKSLNPSQRDLENPLQSAYNQNRAINSKSSILLHQIILKSILLGLKANFKFQQGTLCFSLN